MTIPPALSSIVLIRTKEARQISWSLDRNSFFLVGLEIRPFAVSGGMLFPFYHIIYSAADPFYSRDDTLSCGSHGYRVAFLHIEKGDIGPRGALTSELFTDPPYWRSSVDSCIPEIYEPNVPPPPPGTLPPRP